MQNTRRQVSLEYPLVPLSVNQMWRNFNGRTILSREGRDFKSMISIMTRAQIQVSQFDDYDGQGIDIEAHVFMPNMRTKKGEISLTAGDVDNKWKALGDVIFDCIGINDAHVTKLSVSKHQGEARTVVIFSFSALA